MMSQNDFVLLVSKMREAQKSYFRMRTSQDLQRSKQLERQVDTEVSKYTISNGQAVAQPGLFDEQPAQQPKNKPVIALRCKGCGAVYWMHTLVASISEEDAKMLADAVADGDIAFVADASEVSFSICKCNQKN